MAFLDREAERGVLLDAWTSDRAELVIVYGRRGVGKSQLLLHTLEGRGGLYYQATEPVMAQQLGDIAAEMRRAFGGAIVGQFASIGAFFAAVTALAQSTPHAPLSVVIDEFPYLAQAEQGLESVLQRWWDQTHVHTEPQGLPGWLSRVVDARPYIG